MMPMISGRISNGLKEKVLFFGIFAVFFALSAGVNGKTFAQDAQTPSQDIKVKARAAGADILVAGKFQIQLWGVEAIQSNNAVFDLKARSALEEKIGKEPLECTVKGRKGNMITAQCVNSSDEDLSLFMLQEGFVTVKREVVYDSIFETPYLDAEVSARQRESGIWSLESSDKLVGAGTGNQKYFYGGVVVIGLLFLGLVVISVFIMRGFKTVVDVQNQSMDLASRERLLREKEKYVIASMIDAEIQTNKSKIEAYLMMYESMLRELNDNNITPKYQKSGDIIQKQPALSRSVFDGNTDKLDLLGRQTSSDIIHYYARIKTVPDYVDLETDMPIEEAREIVGSAVEHAKKLDEISDKILDRFASLLLVQTA